MWGTLTMVLEKLKSQGKKGSDSGISQSRKLQQALGLDPQKRGGAVTRTQGDGVSERGLALWQGCPGALQTSREALLSTAGLGPQSR